MRTSKPRRIKKTDPIVIPLNNITEGNAGEGISIVSYSMYCRFGINFLLYTNDITRVKLCIFIDSSYRLGRITRGTSLLELMVDSRWESHEKDF